MQCWHRLALALHRTIDELQETMTAVEFIRWQAWFEQHPSDSEWDDYRIAHMSATITAALTGKKQAIKEHMVGRKVGKVKQTPKQQLAVLTDFKARAIAWQTQQTSAKSR